MMGKNRIVTGLILSGIAVVMMLSALGMLPDLPWFKLLCGIGLFVGWTMKALTNREWFGVFLSSSIIAWIFEKELQIDHLAPFPLCIAAGLFGIGLNMIFEKKKRPGVNYRSGYTRTESMNTASAEEWQDGRTVVLENRFNSTSKYVNSAAFSSAKLENVFGSANVYFNNAKVYEKEAVVELENNFGHMNIYFPNKWRASVSQDAAFGHVNIIGEPNSDMDAPCVVVKASSNFGTLNIYFE